MSDLQYVKLNEWAEGKFREPPSLWTLRRMAREDRFDPPAVKIGKDYHVHPQAKVVEKKPPLTLVRRLRHA